MNTLSLVIEREYSSRVKKKSFILLTIFMPFLFVGLAFVPMWLASIKDSGMKKIAVIDQTGMYAPELKSSDTYKFETIGKNDMADTHPELGKTLFAILQITDDLSKNPKAVTLTSEKQTPIDLQSYIQKTLSEKLKELLEHGMTQGQISRETKIPQGTISRIAAGIHKDPRASNARRIDQLYDKVVREAA